MKAGIKVMFESLKMGFEHWKKKGRKKAREGGKEERRKGGKEEEGRKEGGRREGGVVRRSLCGASTQTASHWAKVKD